MVKIKPGIINHLRPSNSKRLNSSIKGTRNDFCQDVGHRHPMVNITFGLIGRDVAVVDGQLKRSSRVSKCRCLFSVSNTCVWSIVLVGV